MSVAVVVVVVSGVVVNVSFLLMVSGVAMSFVVFWRLFSWCVGECLSVLSSLFVMVFLLLSMLCLVMGTSMSSSLSEKDFVLKKLDVGLSVDVGESRLVCLVSSEFCVRAGDVDCDLFDTRGCECDVMYFGIWCKCCRCGGNVFVALNRLLVVLSNVFMKFSMATMFVSLCLNMWLLSMVIICLSFSDVFGGNG